MDSLPLDTSNPAIRDYLALVRLQVLTPLSLLINIATVLVCATIAKPSIGDITRLYPTSISFHPGVVAVYVLLIYIGQVGYCLLLVFARKPETKKALVKAVGLSLVLANWAMAFWAIAWVLQFFLASTILLGILVLLLAYSNIALLLYHTPLISHPLDVALIHAPLRLFLILPLSLIFPYSLFITLGLTHLPDHPEQYGRNTWPGFAVMLSVNLLGLMVIILHRDITWAIAATWICVSEWSVRPKPPPVFVVVVLFTVLHPLALVSTIMHDIFFKQRQRGAIALPADDDYHQPVSQGRQGPREVDTETWG
ncbi:hypothetical protein SCLCIDRAFT_1223962 [Scleroderma citrinum Foug A]|uniref:Uncharacterized protein n=1 Tax=Scleroderma citrinum Foug A TaxID=1036808 RepID=A0A0C3D742_9AGAM|nr:hypothetical protein SCLCIDRAFT_1223962 [Scleroderma citrinum Foug A]